MPFSPMLPARIKSLKKLVYPVAVLAIPADARIRYVRHGTLLNTKLTPDRHEDWHAVFARCPDMDGYIQDQCFYCVDAPLADMTLHERQVYLGHAFLDIDTPHVRLCIGMETPDSKRLKELMEQLNNTRTWWFRDIDGHYTSGETTERSGTFLEYIP